MAVEKLPPDYTKETKNKLKDINCPKILLLTFNFAFLTIIQHLMEKLDVKFKWKKMKKHYPRTLLLIK